MVASSPAFRSTASNASALRSSTCAYASEKTSAAAPHMARIIDCSLEVAPGARWHQVRKAGREAVAVRHLHLGQRLGVHHVVFADQLVQRQYVRSQRVGLVIGER